MILAVTYSTVIVSVLVQGLSIGKLIDLVVEKDLIVENEFDETTSGH